MVAIGNQTFDVDGVLAAERLRCAALEADDFATLRTIISPAITHTHARGNTDDYESYFAHIERRIRFVTCRRGPLQVRLFGRVAVMNGLLENLVRLRGEDTTVPVRAQAIQVWEWTGERWQLVAFQATPSPEGP